MQVLPAVPGNAWPPIRRNRAHRATRALAGGSGWYRSLNPSWASLRAGRNGQPDFEGGSCAGGALEGDRAAVGDDQLFADVEPQSGSFLSLGGKKRLPDAGLHLGA